MDRRLCSAITKSYLDHEWEIHPERIVWDELFP